MCQEVLGLGLVLELELELALALAVGVGVDGGVGVGMGVDCCAQYLPPLLEYPLGHNSTPDDHLTASPYRRGADSCSGCISGGRGSPTIRTGAVSPARVQQRKAVVVPCPDDHFKAGPYRRVIASPSGCISGGRCSPTIRPGIVLPARVIKKATPVDPAQTIISLPVHTVVCAPRAAGALVVLMAVQLSAPGLYLAPVVSPPPQTIISLPVQIALSCLERALGALVVLVAVQLFVVGLYLPPVLKTVVLPS